MFATDLWQIGIARAPARELLLHGGLKQAEIVWLPTATPYAYLADPFGLWRDGMLHIFAEAYDYRTRRGVIDVLRLSPSLDLIDRRTCLAEPWHLSYPFVFEAEGKTFLLPEAFRSGAVTLYRASDFPHRWEAVARIALDAPAVDPTPFRHDGRWWLAYAPGGTVAARQGHLHLAWAERLTGPWRTHPGNPVRIDRSGARPGGTPIADGDRLYLPVQDCSRTYGGALRALEIVTLDPGRFEARPGGTIGPSPAFGRFGDGFHTLSACGAISLIDAKRTTSSPRAWPIHLRGLARALVA